MSKLQNMVQSVRQTYEKARPGLEKTGDIFGLVCKWAWRLRKFLLAVPVLWLMVYLARLNWGLLPDMVGIGLLNDGSYTRMITREMAVYAPMGVTSVCLLLMMLSRKTFYPWLISMFSMALPLMILLTNFFNA